MPIVAGSAVLGLSLISGAFLVRYLTVHPLQMSSSLLVTSLAAALAVIGLALNFQGAALLGMGAAAGLTFAVSYWITTRRVLSRDDERPVPALTRRKDDAGLGHTAVVYFTHGEPQTYDPIGWLNQFREFDEQKIPFIPVIARPIFIYLLRRKYLQVGMSQHRQNHQRMITRLEESFRADGDLTTRFYLSFLDDHPRPDAALIQALNDGASRVAVAEVFVSISNHTAEGEHQIASVKAEEYGVPIGLSGPLWDSATLHSMFVARANANIGDTDKSKVGIVLVGHGQPDEWDVEFPTETEHEIEFRRRIMAALEADGYRRENMDLAWMEFKDPKPAEKIEHLIKNGVDKILYFSAAISAESIHSQFDIPDLVSKAKVPAGFPIINLGAWNDDPIVIQAIKEKIIPLLPEPYFIRTSNQLDYAEVER
jgi:sirohydrochlorin ferrochelatase